MKHIIIGNYRKIKSYIRPKYNKFKESLECIIYLTLRYMWKATVALFVYEIYLQFIK